MKSMKKLIGIALATVMLSACGGGGSDSGDKDNSGGDNGGVVVNTAPSLTVSKTTLSFNEKESTTFNVVASDKEDSNFNVVVVSDNPLLSALLNGNTVTLLAGEVEVNTVAKVTTTVTDSGGLKKSLVTTVTILNVEAPVVVDAKPVIVVSTEALTMDEKTVSGFGVTASDAEDGSLTYRVLVESSNSALLSVTKNGDYINVNAKEVTESLSVNVKVSVSDSKGQTTSKVVVVNIKDVVNQNNESPKISLANLSEDKSVVIFESKENTIDVILSDPDSSNLTWEIKSFSGISGADFVLDFINSYKKVGDTIVIDAKQIPDYSIVDFSLVLSVTDGNTTTEDTFKVLLTNSPNGAPLFVIGSRVGGFVPVPMGQSKTFKYSFIDDMPEKVKVLELQVWDGDATKFSYSLDTAAQTITVTNTGLPLGADFGLLIKYSDGDEGGLSGVKLKSSVVFGALQTETLAYVQNVYARLEALNEYKYLTEFYVEVAENLNYITGEQARDYLQLSKVNGSGNFITVRNLVSTLEAYVSWGSGDGQDVEWIDNYKMAIETQYDAAVLNYNQNDHYRLNDIADTTEGILPQISSADQVVEYEAGKYSRFKGNVTYGSYVDNKFVFSDEYQFLEAIVAKAIASERQAFSH